MKTTAFACMACLTMCGAMVSAASGQGRAICPPPGPSAGADAPLARSAHLEVARLTQTEAAARTPPVSQQPASRGSWIARHPVLFGSLVGFGAGFLIGYLPGDDGVFYDFTAEFNGMVLGGAGAGAGALVGWAVGRD
jgi:hypothetical protein